ncbi:hypothetical protein PSTG_17357 [Puccinia striiformis f. sp. tritici PST-78]|uniref:Uncharacterized protein n=1 Tax=Puccinia striiformis f. sp. tritici PST-78 TaxID=1165861 RepID=A0A0L0UQ30_9BASI|nr:hypothetical protein PSTG_17357 [Puccinia striiformis f. sp. tritici PST-78]
MNSDARIEASMTSEVQNEASLNTHTPAAYGKGGVAGAKLALFGSMAYWLDG